MFSGAGGTGRVAPVDTRDELCMHVVTSYELLSTLGEARFQRVRKCIARASEGC